MFSISILYSSAILNNNVSLDAYTSTHVSTLRVRSLHRDIIYCFSQSPSLTYAGFLVWTELKSHVAHTEVAGLCVHTASVLTYVWNVLTLINVCNKHPLLQSQPATVKGQVELITANSQGIKTFVLPLIDGAINTVFEILMSIFSMYVITRSSCLNHTACAHVLCMCVAQVCCAGVLSTCVVHVCCA